MWDNSEHPLERYNDSYQTLLQHFYKHLMSINCMTVNACNWYYTILLQLYVIVPSVKMYSEDDKRKNSALSTGILAA